MKEQELKLWWVLAWDQYYPSGELRNVHSTHLTQEDAENEKNKVIASSHYDYVEVVNVSYLLGIKETKDIDDLNLEDE